MLRHDLQKEIVRSGIPISQISTFSGISEIAITEMLKGLRQMSAYDIDHIAAAMGRTVRLAFEEIS